MGLKALVTLPRLRWILLTCVLVVFPSYSWERDDRLAIMAADLLPAILGAQTNFDNFYFPSSESTSSLNKTIDTLVLYRKKSYLAEKVVARVNALSMIQDSKLKATAMLVTDYIASAPSHNSENTQKPKLIFIIDDLGKSLGDVLKRAEQQHHLTFSSSSNDVEKGVALGISVTERVLPMVNMKATQKRDVTFSPLFMRITKKVGE